MSNIKLNTPSSGSITLTPANTASNLTVTVPATAGTMVVQDGSNITTVTNLAYTGTLTGGTGVVNIGSGQVYKDASGNVGIGTSSPAIKLDVNGGIRIGYQAAPTWTSDSFLWSESGVGLNIDGYQLKFNTGLSRNERMRIDPFGNVGIGTSSPNSRLDVRGNALIGAGGDDGGRITISGTVGYAGTGLSLIENSTGNGRRLRLSQETTGSVYNATFSTGGNAHIWQLGNVEVMRLDVAGNLGLGVTPSAWNTTKVMQLGRSAAIYGDGQLLNWVAGISMNAYGSASGVNRVWAYASSGEKAYRYEMGNGAGGSFDGHVWFNAPSGTAGNAISFTQAMTLDANGNLLVGTTSSGGAGGVSFRPNNTGITNVVWNRASSPNTSYPLEFQDGGSIVGFVSYTNTVTTYASISDYRLKENVQPMTGALAKVAALKPCTYKWKVDGSAGQGFIAHELQAIVPDCVTGIKDAVDKDGKPQYQGVDTSFLVATLVKAIQELKAEVDALKGAA